MKKVIRCICLISLVIFSSVYSVVSVHANSAQTRWSGTDSTSAIMMDEDCPIIVEKELLTFDLNEFPESYYHDVNDFLAYTGKVTAEYTFYNPSDYTVTATLVFPFGGISDYGDIYDFELDKRFINADTQKFDITMDGQVIDKQLRHTLMYHGHQFDLKQDLEKLHDGFMVDDFYSPDLPVTKYTYQPKDVDQENHRAATAAIRLIDDNVSTRVYMENQSGGSTLEDGVLLSTWVDLEESFSVYILGEPLKEDLQWVFYHNGACEEEIDGMMALLSTETTTLKEFALSQYDTESGVLDYDWYNAVITSLKLHEWTNGAIHSMEAPLNVSDMLMRWYQYEMTVEPKQRIVNAVTAPIYPAINSKYEPPVFTYTYLLSPAKTWKEFGNLDIVVNTPHYMIESKEFGFEYNNPGYELHLTGLPEGELVFTLCADPNPIIPVNMGYYLPYIMVGGTFLSATALIFFIISMIKKKRRLEKENTGE